MNFRQELSSDSCLEEGSMSCLEEEFMLICHSHRSATGVFLLPIATPAPRFRISRACCFCQSAPASVTGRPSVFFCFSPLALLPLFSTSIYIPYFEWLTHKIVVCSHAAPSNVCLTLTVPALPVSLFSGKTCPPSVPDLRLPVPLFTWALEIRVFTFNSCRTWILTRIPDTHLLFNRF